MRLYSRGSQKKSQNERPWVPALTLKETLQLHWAESRESFWQNQLKTKLWVLRQSWEMFCVLLVSSFTSLVLQYCQDKEPFRDLSEGKHPEVTAGPVENNKSSCSAPAILCQTVGPRCPTSGSNTDWLNWSSSRVERTHVEPNNLNMEQSHATSSYCTHAKSHFKLKTLTKINQMQIRTMWLFIICGPLV